MIADPAWAMRNRIAAKFFNNNPRVNKQCGIKDLFIKEQYRSWWGGSVGLSEEREQTV
jgi:hypothetical protein